MNISMHSASAPVFLRTLNGMLTWLDKAQAHAEVRKFDANNYLTSRLAPDMLPFTRQIQITTDGVKACMARLAGQEVPKWEDNEATLDDLRARINKTLAFVASFTPAQINGSEMREIVLPMRTGDPKRFDGENFLKHYALPNFFFHATTTYALLRAGGVDLGKRDFLA